MRNGPGPANRGEPGAVLRITHYAFTVLTPHFATPSVLCLSHHQPLDRVRLVDRLELVDDAAGDVLADVGRQRGVVGARELQVVALGVVRARGVGAEDEHGARLVRAVRGAAVD